MKNIFAFVLHAHGTDDAGAYATATLGVYSTFTQADEVTVGHANRARTLTMIEPPGYSVDLFMLDVGKVSSFTRVFEAGLPTGQWAQAGQAGKRSVVTPKEVDEDMIRERKI